MNSKEDKTRNNEKSRDNQVVNEWLKNIRPSFWTHSEQKKIGISYNRQSGKYAKRRRQIEKIEESLIAWLNTEKVRSVDRINVASTILSIRLVYTV